MGCGSSAAKVASTTPAKAPATREEQEKAATRLQALKRGNSGRAEVQAKVQAQSAGKVCTPCARAECGYFRTWHKTHCCNACQSHAGHGPKCEKKEDPAKKALLEARLTAAVAGAGDPHKALKEWAGKAKCEEVPIGRKLNVLCLHGITMNGGQLRGMSNPLTKQCEDFANFYFPTAPHQIDANHSFCKKNNKKPGPEAKTWTLEGDKGKGREDFAPHLCDFVEKEVPGPVDVLLGYSQGGFSIHQLLNTTAKNSSSLPDKLLSARAVVILMSGGMCKSCVKLRSLHVIGLKDKIVGNSASEKSAFSYVNPVIAKLDVDHVGPFKLECAHVTKEFLRGMHDFHGSFPRLCDL